MKGVKTMLKTKIEWCDATWNPITGCRHECEYCYARRLANRFGRFTPSNFAQKSDLDSYNNCFELFEHEPGNPYPFLFAPTLHLYRLNQYDNVKGRNIFVCSMADLFGNWIPDKWIDMVISKCFENQQHNYLFLTKNPKKYKDIINKFGSNQWIGTTVTSNIDIRKNAVPLFQAKRLSKGKCKVFISLEPLLEKLCPIEIMAIVKGSDWIIVGAETGNRKSKVIPQKAWIDAIVEICIRKNVPIFMKNSLIPIIGEDNMLRQFPKELMKEEVHTNEKRNG